MNFNWNALAGVVGTLHNESRLDAVAAAGNAADLFPASSRSPPSSSNHTSVVDFLEGAEVERCIHFNNPETCTYGACGRRNGSLQLYSADPDPDPDPQPNAAAAPTSGEGVCSICEEDAAHVRSVEWLLDDEGSPIEQFDKDVCDHHFCLECLGHWVHASLESSARILCPGEGCACQMMLDDVRRLDGRGASAYSTGGSGNSLAERMHDMMYADHDALHETIAADPAVAAWVEENTAECPSCRMVIERSDGCDEMVCHCGERFSYHDAGGPRGVDDDYRDDEDYDGYG